MYRSLLPATGDLVSRFDQIQQEMQQLFGGTSAPASIRAVASGSFPQLNVTTTPAAVEIAVFAPGIEPSQLEITLDRGVLSVTGERTIPWSADGVKTSVYTRERFAGKFKRTVNLPEDINPDNTQARYVDGILYITVQRTTAPQPKRIEVR